MPETPTTLAFRLPRSTYLAVLFLVFCVLPLSVSATGAEDGTAGLGWRSILLVIPVLAAVFIARTATFVGPDGLRVRALFGSHTTSWDQARGLSIEQRAVYVVRTDGAVRLPCVRTSDLAAIAAVSGGRLPDIPRAPVKYAPSKRRR